MAIWVKTQCQWEGWDCFFSPDQKFLGGSLCKSTEKIIFHSKSTAVLILDNQQAGNPYFTQVLVGNGGRWDSLRQSRVWLQTLDPELCNWHCREISSHCISVNKNIFASVRRFGKYDGISSASMCKCSFSEIIIIILLSGSVSCSSKKADKTICKFHFHLFLF